MAHSFISIKKFTKEPYSNILGYPNATNRQIKSRINELEKLKIKSICLVGPTTIGSLAILGKGYVGVVVLVKRGNKEVALKIRRIDSQRKNMKNESISLNLANLKLLFSKSFLLVILISISSAIVADYFNIPLAWMLGPMIAISLAALGGIKVKMPKLALSSILIVLGLHIGNYIDQNLINQPHLDRFNYEVFM